MPRAADTRVDSYLAVLEMAMLDGFLAEHEKSSLVETAVLSGLTRGQVLDLHADYLRAMAELGAGPHRSGDIAGSYKARVTSLAPTRNSLIVKGMVWSPNHGDTAFTVPMFDEFMKRTMPGEDWR